MGAAWQEYFRFLDSLGGVLAELAEIAREKTNAVRHDDLMTVNECMRREQALSLRLRSMDRTRDQMRARLGILDTPLSGLADKAPEELRYEARDTAKRLRDQYDIYRSAAEVARNTLELNLHEIEKLAAERMPPNPENRPLADIRA